MDSKPFPASVLREFSQWLRQWADYAQAQADQLEAGGPEAGATLPGEGERAAGKPSAAESGPPAPGALQPGGSPPAHWLEASRSPGPPAHWLALFEEGAETEPAAEPPKPADVDKQVAKTGAELETSPTAPDSLPAWFDPIQQGVAALLQSLERGETPQAPIQRTDARPVPPLVVPNQVATPPTLQAESGKPPVRVETLETEQPPVEEPTQPMDAYEAGRRLEQRSRAQGLALASVQPGLPSGVTVTRLTPEPDEVSPASAWPAELGEDRATVQFEPAPAEAQAGQPERAAPLVQEAASAPGRAPKVTRLRIQLPPTPPAAPIKPAGSAQELIQAAQGALPRSADLPPAGSGGMEAQWPSASAPEQPATEVGVEDQPGAGQAGHLRLPQPPPLMAEAPQASRLPTVIREPAPVEAGNLPMPDGKKLEPGQTPGLALRTPTFKPPIPRPAEKGPDTAPTPAAEPLIGTQNAEPAVPVEAPPDRLPQVAPTERPSPEPLKWSSPAAAHFPDLPPRLPPAEIPTGRTSDPARRQRLDREQRGF